MPYRPVCTTALWYTGFDGKAAFLCLCDWARASTASAHHSLKPLYCSVTLRSYFQPGACAVTEIAILLQ